MALCFAETAPRMHGGLPHGDRRSFCAENGVQARQRHRGDCLAVIRGRGLALDLGILTRRIAADDQEIHASLVPAVARTRREEDDVAGDLDPSGPPISSRARPSAIPRTSCAPQW